MYGITDFDKNLLKLKLKNQKKFLDENFLFINGEYKPYSDFYFSSWHNSNRYIAELNNCVSSLNKYANRKSLKPIFAVLTLPTQYHQKKQITLKSGRKKLVYNNKFIDDENHTVKAGANKLQSVVRSIMNSKHFRKIPKNERCYITTKEPHLDGTCHLNLLVFVPEKYVNDCALAIKSRFLDTHSKITIDIKNPTAYVMKYIFKTLDDLRKNPNVDNLTDITFWYLKHRIRRFTMSLTFISLEIYRKLSGRIDLISLTKNYNKGLITVLIDENNKPIVIFDEFGEIWQKKRVKEPILLRQTTKLTKPSKKDIIYHKAINRYMAMSKKELQHFYRYDSPKDKNYYTMTDFELMQEYFYATNPQSDFNNPLRLAILENEMLDRGLDNFTKNQEIHNLNNSDELYYDFIDQEKMFLDF
ncbi:hypothetical protein [Campylobacter ureolyticus]|uniref:hypothetical protein n=1 Tax=Campylobacter ureolyticus TaxID=827 RepID=UPI0022B3C3EF|nr:hypothetical protein [Campylobacter ureolyticus]MCZ6134052.1 hypothetical protein [Campylobacter ureolyticus]